MKKKTIAIFLRNCFAEYYNLRQNRNDKKKIIISKELRKIYGLFSPS